MTRAYDTCSCVCRCVYVQRLGKYIMCPALLLFTFLSGWGFSPDQGCTDLSWQLASLSSSPVFNFRTVQWLQALLQQHPVSYAGFKFSFFRLHRKSP